MNEDFFNEKITRREFCAWSAKGLASSFLVSSLSGNTMLSRSGQKGLIIKDKDAMYWENLAGRKIRCGLCPNRCTIRKNDRGVCQVRQEKDNKLYTYAYANPSAVHIDPIEKKPLYHFLPSGAVFSLATAGCNFSCLNCQNWQLSQFPPEETFNYRLLPEDVVLSAKEQNCPMIAYTYSEPSVFYEYMYETSKIAREAGIRNIYVTNGYINQEPLHELCKYIDAANVDIKGFSEAFYSRVTGGMLKPVLESVKTMYDSGVHVELTNLVIPGYNDTEQMIKPLCNWILSNLGDQIPLHFSRFTPLYKLKSLAPTPASVLQKARQTAMNMGIKYVYIGNIMLPSGSDTVCPSCGKLLIRRKGYSITVNNIQNSSCKYCKTAIPGIWQQ